MGYVKYKAVTKPFNFSSVIDIDKETLPAYVKQYIRDELILVAYKTSRDHGIFTDKKIVILDLFLNSGYPETLKFVNLTAEEKLRLRILYTCVNRLINDQEPLKMDMDRLLNNDISLSNKK